MINLNFYEKTSLCGLYRKVPTVTPIETKQEIIQSRLEGGSYRGGLRGIVVDPARHWAS